MTTEVSSNINSAENLVHGSVDPVIFGITVLVLSCIIG